MENFVHQLEEIRDLATQVIQDSAPTGFFQFQRAGGTGKG